jgi:hypothetical protein
LAGERARAVNARTGISLVIPAKAGIHLDRRRCKEEQNGFPPARE